MTIEHPTCLLYLLTVGRDKELVLRVHGTELTTEQLTAWRAGRGATRGQAARFVVLHGRTGDCGQPRAPRPPTARSSPGA